MRGVSGKPAWTLLGGGDRDKVGFRGWEIGKQPKIMSSILLEQIVHACEEIIEIIS